MPKMNFGMERVLTYRKDIENVRKLEFAAAQQEYFGSFERLKDEESRVDSINVDFNDRQREGITATELELYAVFFRRKSADIKLQREETANLSDRMTEKRNILVEAAKDKKVLETLKDKQVQAHKQELLYKERIFMEEIALRKKGDDK